MPCAAARRRAGRSWRRSPAGRRPRAPSISSSALTVVLARSASIASDAALLASPKGKGVPIDERIDGA